MQRAATLFAIGSKDSRIGGGDNFVDRLSCYYTVLILSVFAVGITTMQCLDEEPIFCWCPAHFTDSHVNFTNKACWIQNTYYLPIEETEIPSSPKRKQYISYYQWVALALGCQAFLFYIPRPLWLLLNKKSGISVSVITDAAIEYQKTLNIERRDKILRYLTKLISKFLIDLNRQQLVAGKVKGMCLVLYGNHLFVAYMVVKVIYLANVALQVFWMNSFLSTDYHMYGFRVLNKMLRGESWATSDRFPRVTLCDISIRELGNIHNYTVQCSLPLNLLNEKLYIFIWFWFFFVAIATLSSILTSCVELVYIPKQVNFVRSCLEVMDKIEYNGDKDVGKFVRQFMRRDGMFIVNLVAQNSSDMIAAELLSALWDAFNDNKRRLEHLDIESGRERRHRVRRLLTRDASLDSVQTNDSQVMARSKHEVHCFTTTG